MSDKSVSSDINAQGPNLVADPISKLLMQLAIPSAIGFLFITLYNLVDSIWANQLGRVMQSSNPADALAAGSGYFFLMMAVAIGISQGATSMISNAIGRGDMAAARTHFFQSIGLGILASIILAVVGVGALIQAVNAQFADRPVMAEMALDYLVPVYICTFSFVLSLTTNSALTAQGDFVTMSIVQFSAFLLNCVLDPLFMFGFGPIPGFGIQGLAIATVSINGAGLLFTAYRTYQSNLFANFSIKDLKLEFFGLGDMLKQCVPATLNMVVFGVGYIVISDLLDHYSEGTLGGFGNASRLEQIILLPIIGLQIAVLAIVGQNWAAGQFDRVKRTFTISILTSLVMMLIGMLLVWLSYDFMSGIWAAGNQNVHAMSNLYLLYSSTALISYALIIISTGVLQGMKQPIIPLLVNITRMIVAPLAFFYAVKAIMGTTPSIHTLYAGVVIIAWICGLFSIGYVWQKLNSMESE